MNPTAISQLCNDSLNSRIAARVVIGVTGHRQLVARPDLMEGVGSAIEQIRQMVPSSPDTPVGLTILTPLAEGADRMVAREVLRIPGSTMEVILPMEKDEYLQDFRTSQSRAEFEELLSRATTVGRLAFKGSQPESYEEVGRYVVDQCDVLIALWDGNQAGGQGGTADVVQYARETGCPLLWVDTEHPGKVTVERGHGIDAKPFQDLDEYNSEQIDIAKFNRNLKDQHDLLIHQAENAGLPSDTVQPILEYFVRHLVRADMLASRYQHRYQRAGTIVYVFAAAAVVLAATQIIFIPDKPRILIGEVVFMIVILAIVWVGRAHRWHEKWLDYRFLTERFRSATFMAACDIDVATLRPPRHLSLAYSSHDWMVAAFSSVWNRRPIFRRRDPPPIEGLRRFLREAWIEDQIRYQDEASKWHHRQHQLMSGVSNALFGLTLLAALLHVVDFGPHTLENALAAMVIAFPATAASIAGIRTHRDYLRKSMRSAEMASHLRELRDKMARDKERESFLKLVSETEETMLRENEDWRVVVRFHTPELPV